MSGRANGLRQHPRRSRWLHSRPVLLFAFAFAIMADPVSSVAYAIEAALRALGNDLSLLLPTMVLVLGLIAVVILNYHQLVARYPRGGGAAAAAGDAFGEAWAFVPMGALIVDFVLTIAISCAAAGAALIAYLPALAPWRVPLAVVLVVAVGALTWFGHIGRAVFATMTVGFIAAALLVLVYGAGAQPHPTGTISATPPHAPPVAIALAFPVAMALATGVEAPSSAIAQLGQLGGAGRRRFGRITLWLTLGIVSTITLGLTIEATRLRVGEPHANTTQIAELARVAAPAPLFAVFQIMTALLLLADLRLLRLLPKRRVLLAVGADRPAARNRRGRGRTRLESVGGVNFGGTPKRSTSTRLASNSPFRAYLEGWRAGYCGPVERVFNLGSWRRRT